jgi:galactitol-specific phosphotransferase system IIC component
MILPFAGIVTGVIIAVVVGVKRGNHRRRLLAERFPPRY